MQSQVSAEFLSAIQDALSRARSIPDDAVNYMVNHVPVYAQYAPDPGQAQAGGCSNCTYLGLWASGWRDYPSATHGLVWLFESGIRRMGGDLREQTLSVLLHEFQHALQRDHVLDAVERQMRADMYRPQTRSCCPGR